MATPRYYFHLGTIISGGEEKMFALTDTDGPTYLNTVEEWVEESSTWKAADNLLVKRSSVSCVGYQTPCLLGRIPVYECILNFLEYCGKGIL